MTCKICDKNETDSTSGICWECANTYHKPLIEPPFDMGEGHSDCPPIEENIIYRPAKDIMDNDFLAKKGLLNATARIKFI